MNSPRQRDPHGSAGLLQRIQVSPTRTRVADVLVTFAEREQIVVTPPALIIEIMSPDDTLSDYFERITDYSTMGVGAIWLLDPQKKRAFIGSRDGIRPVDVLRAPLEIVKGHEIRLRAAEIFTAVLGDDPGHGQNY